MIQTIKKAWGIPELRKKIIFTALILLIFRIGNAIPVPYVNTDLLSSYLEGMSTTVLGLYNVMSGGAFAQATVFALGVQPYINSSIIIQLLTIAIPALERLARDGGEEGKKKIQSITRYATVAIAILQGWGYYMLMKNYGILTEKSFWVALVIIASFIAGSSFVMWMGEQITEFGIGNGISIIIFAGIVAGLPNAVTGLMQLVSTGAINPLAAIFVIAVVLAVTAFVVFMERGQRRITVNYARRQVGRRIMGGQSTYLPLKINMANVIPPIFASSLILFPATVAGWMTASDSNRWLRDLAASLAPGQPIYTLLYATLIVFFAYFYTALVFNPKETADNLKKGGAFIPGIRPGDQTAKYIDRVLQRLTLSGAIYLVFVCLVPEFLNLKFNVPFYFGGTSLLIVVVVAMDFMSQVQAYLMSHQYESLLRKTNFQGFGRGM